MKPMTQTRLLCLFAALTFLNSCTTSKALTSKVLPTEVNDIQRFETFSYITLIEAGNKGKLNDTLSRKVKEIFHEALTSFSSIPLTGTIYAKDITVQKEIEREVEYLCLSADSQRSISGLKLTPVLDSLLDVGGKRFGLITITTGFTRAKGNYGGQIAKGAAIGILTLGLGTQTPIKATSTVYAMIVDAKDNNVAFFRKSFLQDKEPLDKSIMTKQIQKIFDGYFWKK